MVAHPIRRGDGVGLQCPLHRLPFVLEPSIFGLAMPNSQREGLPYLYAACRHIESQGEPITLLRRRIRCLIVGFVKDHELSGIRALPLFLGLLRMIGISAIGRVGLERRQWVRSRWRPSGHHSDMGCQ